MEFDALGQLPYFSIESYKQLAQIEPTRAHTARVQISRWTKAGKLLRLKRGSYMTRDFYLQHAKDVDFLAAVSAIINPHSYLSSSYILQRGNILTEVTHPITAITYKNTRTVTNSLGTFTYQHIQPNYYTGFSPQNYYGIIFYQATLAKALFDYLYLRPLTVHQRASDYNLAEELRLNLMEFSTAERIEFAEHVAASALPKMQAVLRNFQEHIW